LRRLRNKIFRGASKSEKYIQKECIDIMKLLKFMDKLKDLYNSKEKVKQKGIQNILCHIL
jgi:hypothetical protein